ncbi:MAG: hypothetical protein MJZ34_10540 [Paludibacteraceae bacterium]|nr:hypothetical protein [Paludibacteraceae bacterium]
MRRFTFKDFYERSKSLLTEKVTLSNMINDFKKLFKHSFTDLAVGYSKEKNQGLSMICTAQVESEKGGKSYSVSVQMHRKTQEEPYTIKSPCEVKCSCKAFQYYTSYQLYANKNLYGKPSRWNKTPNQERNTKNIPTVCKHLYSYIRYLVQKGVIRQ